MAHPELTGAAEQRLEALPRRHALVIGGTGMLADVARALARRGDAVTVVSRTGLGSIAGRWLTHAEIAEGVLAALDRDAPVQVVGTRD